MGLGERRLGITDQWLAFTSSQVRVFCFLFFDSKLSKTSSRFITPSPKSNPSPLSNSVKSRKSSFRGGSRWWRYVLTLRVDREAKNFVQVPLISTVINGWSFHFCHPRKQHGGQTDEDKGRHLGTMVYPNWKIKKGCIYQYTCSRIDGVHIDGLVQERCNFSALAMELRLSCTNPSIWCW